MATSPYINHFIQPDTIIPNPADPQSWNRYSYVQNNPIRYTDPTGHKISYADNGALTDKETKYLIEKKFGVTMSDDGDKSWDNRNQSIVYISLHNIDVALNGELKSFAQGWTFKMRHQESGYHGFTSTDGSKLVTFFTDDRDIVKQNIYHEVGHLIDSVPGMENIFSRRPGINNGDFLNEYGKLDVNALIDKTTPDMYQHPYSVYTDDVSDMLYGQAEHWADMFANYVAGNIDLDSPEGRAMNTYVEDALQPYIGIP